MSKHGVEGEVLCLVLLTLLRGFTGKKLRLDEGNNTTLTDDDMTKQLVKSAEPTVND